jgi:uncharacterized protein YdaU (DUF1376 family)
MNYYKFHIGDYLTRTMHLAEAEDLAYRRLLDLYYVTERPLSGDMDELVKRIRLDADVIEPVLEEFFELTDDGWYNERCDDEIKKYRRFVKHNQQIALKQGKLRTQKAAGKRLRKGSEQVEPAVDRRDILRSACGEPEGEPAVDQTNNQEPITKKKDSSSTASTPFETFWTTWPASNRKVAKAACEKIWKSRKLDDTAPEIIAHVRAMKQTEQWRDGFEPAPKTYLTQSRWLDDLPVSNDIGDAAKTGNVAGRRVV